MFERLVFGKWLYIVLALICYHYYDNYEFEYSVVCLGLIFLLWLKRRSIRTRENRVLKNTESLPNASPKDEKRTPAKKVKTKKSQKVDLNFINDNCDSLLREATLILWNEKAKKLTSKQSDKSGVYIISRGEDRYIGESVNISSRIKQHGKGKSSINVKSEALRQFTVKTLDVEFGRNEVEEYGIQKLKCSLNTTYSNNTAQFDLSSKPLDKWKKVQLKQKELCDEALRRLQANKSHAFNEARLGDNPGVYLITKGKQIVYVGESNNLGKRHKDHAGAKSEKSALRRNIGRDLFKFELVSKTGKSGQPLKKKGFTNEQELIISAYLSQCSYQSIVVRLGRAEIESYIINKLSPILNRK